MTLRISSRRRRRQRGNTILESGLCFLGFMMLSFGLIEFSLAVYAYNFCSYAARDASRWAAVHGAHSGDPCDGDDVRSFVRNEAVALVSNNIQVSTTWSPNNHPGSEVQVQVSYVVNPIVNLVMREPLSVSSTSRMLISR